MDAKTKQLIYTSMARKYSFFRCFLTIPIAFFFCVTTYAQHTTDFKFVETAPSNIRKTMETNVKAVIAEINNAYDQNKVTLTLSSANSTQEAIDRIKSLWNTSHFYCTETDITTRILQVGRTGKWQVINIPVFFIKGETDREQYQDIVIEFTSSGKIDDMYPVIQYLQYKEILENSNEVTDTRRRQVILDFVENFRTSYNRKDRDYLNKVFSNDALIITGKVLKKQRQREIPTPIDVTVEYIKQTKKEYLDRLNVVFNNNEYINVMFDDINVIQHGRNKNVYGVTLFQKWNTPTYSDKGWLFIVIDFSNEDNPLIWVRTWQPYQYVSKDNVFKLDDFIIR